MSLYLEHFKQAEDRRNEIRATNRTKALLFGGLSSRENVPATMYDSARLVHAVEALYDGQDPNKKLKVALSGANNILGEAVTLTLQPFLSVSRIISKTTSFSGEYKGRIEVRENLEIRDPKNLGPITRERRAKTGWFLRQEIGADGVTTAQAVDQAIVLLYQLVNDNDRIVAELPNELSSLDQSRLQSLGQISLQLNPQS